MNTLKGRVLIVLRGAGQPLSARQIGRILGLPTRVVTSPASRLCELREAEAEVRDGQRFYRPAQQATV